MATPRSSGSSDPGRIALERAASQRMSNVDTAWFRMEDITNQMTITAVLTLDAPVSAEDIRRVLKERFLTFERFRQRVRRPRRSFQNPRWEEDPAFDLDHHLKRATLPAPGRKEQLQDLAGELMSAPLDFARPLWQFHVVDGYEPGGAVIVRLHHSIADGVTLVRVLLSLTDATADASAGGAPGQNKANALAGASKQRKDESGVREPQPVARWFVDALKTAGKKGACAAKMAARGVGVLGKLAWPAPDPDTCFRGQLGREKRAAWSKPVPLADVKAIGRALGGTVNDVLLTAMTGALRRYLEERGEATNGLDIRAAVPVNLRPPEAPATMGNGFGLVFLALPVGTRDPAERLETLRRRMGHLKCSPEAPLLLKVLEAIGAGTRAVEDCIVRFLARKVTAVATNVPGPKQKRYLAGAPLETLMAWVPQAARVGLGLSIISYDGEVRLGLATDANLVPDPGAIIDGFYREFDMLLLRVPGRDRTLDVPTEGGDVPAGQPVTGSEANGKTEAEQQETSKTEPAPSRCEATTKAGTRCKLPAQEGSRFCHVHQP